MNVGFYGSELPDYYAKGPFPGPHWIQMNNAGVTGGQPGGEASDEYLKAVAARIHEIHSVGKRCIVRLWFYPWVEWARQGLYLPTYTECVERIDRMMSFLNLSDVYAVSLLEETVPLFDASLLNSVYDYVKSTYHQLPVFQEPTWWAGINPYWGTQLKCDGYIINADAANTQDLWNFYVSQPKPMKVVAETGIDWPWNRAGFWDMQNRMRNAGIEDLIIYAIDVNGYYAWEDECDPVMKDFFKTFVLPLAPKLPPELDLSTIAGIAVAIADVALVIAYAVTQMPKKF